MLGLTGLFAPIVTPFTDGGGSVSEIRLARLLKHLQSMGINGFVCCSETGEFTTVSAVERKQTLEIVIREARGAPVLAHATRLGTAQSLDLCQHAGRHGAKAAVMMPPYFGTHSDDEIEQHFRTIVQHAGLPVIIVDPDHRIRHGLMDSLSALPELHFAETPEAAMRSRFAVDPIGSGSDEFVIEEAVVSPLIQIDPKGVVEGANFHKLSRIIGDFGRVRVAKAALNLRDIEVGPPRAPVLALPHAAVLELDSVIVTK